MTKNTFTSWPEYADSDFLTEWIKDEQAPRSRSVSGYGSKIPTHRRVKCSDGRTRRVYARCYSNAASFYIIVDERDLFIREHDIPD